MAKIPIAASLTPARVRRLARGGETDEVEFKSQRGSSTDVIDACVCFANGDGGLILWGVDDDRTLSGTTFRDPVALQKAIFNATSPSQLVQVQGVDVDGVRVIAVWVEHSPVLVSTTRGSYTQRVGRDCLPMTPDRLLVRQIDTRAIDLSAAVTPVGIDGVDDVEVERFRRLLPGDESGDRLRRLSREELLETVGATKMYGSHRGLTVAGLLIFGREDEIRATVPQHQVVYVRSSAGTTEYERRLVTSLPLLRLLE
ncbi:MAG: ATP-binding protein, partial [Chloroflexi bacterium]